ncbi:MAG TPA: CinA family protein [Stellaceae bacterium]|nr:CinA family protein [Stellaceae bacterium]
MIRAERLLDECRRRKLKLATAESCTGGLIAGLLTEIAGSSDVVGSGFITYSNDSKTSLLGVRPELIEQYGAVSEPVARAMAEGALARSGADVTVAVTGVAGPGGGSAAKPVGLVHFAAASRTQPTIEQRREFGDIGRGLVRLHAVSTALEMIEGLVMADEAS